MADETPPAAAPNNAPVGSDSPEEGDSLEGADDQANPGTNSTQTATATTSASSPTQTAKPPSSSKNNPVKVLSGRFSIYLLLFVGVVVIALVVVVVTYLHSKSKEVGPVTSQTLSQSSLNQLAQGDVTVGDVKQTLSVQSNAVFAGTVLVRKNLQIAGSLQVSGSLALSSLTVSGSSAFDQLQVNKNLQVAGDTAMQGQLSIDKSLSVNGSGTFNGTLSAPTLNVSTLNLNGDLNLSHHVTAGGSTPTRSNGGALGGGGTASISGSDTAGSIAINTGSNPVAGCFLTVTFASKFNNTPHVVVTPIEAAAGGLQYYVTRTTSSFSVCTANAAPAGQSFGFDYIVFD